MTMVRVVRGAASGLACILMLQATGAGRQNPDQSTQGRVVIETDVISVPTTVLDNRGRLIKGLQKEDFQLREDGVLQELTSFSMQESPIRVTLLLDVSGSMVDRIAEVKRAASQFMKYVGPNDLIKVIQFDHVVKPLVDFSGDPARLKDAIAAAKTEGGGTALHNALWAALADLEAKKASDEAEKRHRAIILLTDGEDTASAVTADEIVLKARRVDALIYSLSLEREHDKPVRNGPASLVLKQLADLSGGDLQFPELSNLGRHYQDLADQLRQQYMLGYVSSSTSTHQGWRAIKVDVNRRNLNLRYRQGYFTYGKEP